MSTLIVEICEIKEVRSHPDPETTALEIAVVKGWEVVTRKGQFKAGDKAVFIPVDSILPSELANGPTDDPPGRLGVKNYLASGGRVRAARLRGAKSFGLIFELNPELGDDLTWPVGTDVAEHYGITKWVPPLRCVDGDAERPHPRFHKYTDIENIRNYPNAILEGEEVSCSEKIHGSNGRLGYVLDQDESGAAIWTWMAGSHNVRRKEFDVHGKSSRFFDAMSPQVKELLSYLALEYPWKEPKFGVIVFLEIYGSGIQDMAYGFQNGRWGTRAFDVAINEQYLDDDVKDGLFKRFGVERVPVLYRGPFSQKIVEEFTDGPTTVCDPQVAGKFRGREGIVITPVNERYSKELGGRCIVKSVSIDYLTRKAPVDNGE
jgi:RNA ligase (TIGR02306 family)